MTYRFAFLVFLALLGTSVTAHADQAEAKEVARINNCPPKKVEVYQQSIGNAGTTIYHVDCNMPKATGEKGSAGPDALLISCDQSLCSLLRPVAAAKK